MRKRDLLAVALITAMFGMPAFAETEIVTGDITTRRVIAAGQDIQYNGASVSVSKQAAGSGGAVYANSFFKVLNSSFTSNKAGAYGGAIEFNTGINGSISDSVFRENYSVYGGGAIDIYKGSVDIKDTTFASNRTAQNGGAFVSDGTVTITGTSKDKMIFSENHAANEGGAIYVFPSPASTTFDNVTFENNYTGNSGGALFTSGNAVIKNVLFKSNYTTNADDTLKADGTVSYRKELKGGGALQVGGTSNITIESSEFNSNHSAAYGGALRTRPDGSYGTDIMRPFTIKDTIFKDNYANYDGGAIMLLSGVKNRTLTLTDTDFKNNSAALNGGAIYADADNVIINAVNSDVTFSGNTANGSANDIYNLGALTLNAASGKTISLAGGIDGDSSKLGTVMMSGSGVIDVAGSLKNQTVNVSSGELKLSKGEQDGSNIAGGIITVNSGSVINTVDGVINNYSDKITLENGSNVRLDVDLNALTADTFTIASGNTVTLTELKVLKDFAAGTTTQDINISSAGNITADNVLGYTNDYKYTATGNASDNGKITVTQGTEGSGGLNNAIADTTDSKKENVTYTITGSGETYKGSSTTSEEEIAANTTFTIEGQNKTITADNTDANASISVKSTSTLTVNNTTLSSFKDDTNGAINNAGTLNLNDVTISASDNSAEHSIVNSGTANVLGNSQVASVSNSGILNIDSGVIDTQDAGAIVNSITNTGDVTMKIIDYVKQEQNVNTLITNSETTSIGNTTIDLQLSDHTAKTSEGVAWTIADGGMKQKTVTFTGDGHLMLKGGTITADVANKMTGNTLVVENAIDGNFTNTDTDTTPHAVLANGSSISGTITNDGLLEIMSGSFTINNGIQNTATNKGTTNIGNGTTASVVTLATGGTPDTITQNVVNIMKNSTLSADASKLTIDGGTLYNAGTFDIISGAIGYSIDGYTDTDSGVKTYGITSINVGDGNTFTYDRSSANEIKTSIKLETGTLQVTNGSSGDIDLSNAQSVIAGNGILDVQDSKVGTINLGALDLTNSDLTVKTDVDFSSASGPADVLSASSVTGSNSVIIDTINALNFDSTLSYDIKIADSKVSSYVDFSNTTITGTGTNNVMFSYYITDSKEGNIKGGVVTLKDAVTTDEETKLFNMGADDDVSTATDLTMKGTYLAITADGRTIEGGDTAISTGNGQTLSVLGGTTGATLTGFTDDAINNAAGGTINLTKVTVSAASTDKNNIANNGTLNLSDDNTILSVTGNGTTNITSGTTTLANTTDTLNQGVVNVSSGATLDNSGTVTAALNNAGTVSDTSGTGTLNLTGTSSNTGDITQSKVTNSGTFTNAGTLNGDVTSNSGTVNNSGTISGDVTSAGTLNNSGKITGDVTNDGTLNDTAAAVYGNTVTNNGIWNATAAAVNTTTGVTLGDGSTLNLANGSIDKITTPITVAAGEVANMKIDLNTANGADYFSGGVTGGQVAFTDINLSGEIPVESYNGATVNLSELTGISAANIANSTLASQILTPIRYLQGSVDNAMLTYAPTGGRNDYNSFNPSVVTSEVAAQANGFLSQLAIYDQAFGNMDMYMMMTKSERQAMKFQNKYAAMDGDYVFDPTMQQFENKAGWFRPYANFERVGLKNGPDISNVMYGTFLGGDSELYDLGNGWDGMFSVYASYNGSHQAYQGNSIYQNGGGLGVMGAAYKGDFFGALTANVGASAGDAKTMYGSENFGMLMTGVAGKAGYNWELADGRFIIQPNYQMSYSFINTFDYTNAAGVRINSDPLHAITLEPGVKFIGNLPHGWQPYAGVSVVWNILDKTEVKANDVQLPQMSVKPYAKYGVGVRKKWGERLTGFIQAFLTSGGRNGIGLQFGLRWALGKSEPNKNKKSNHKLPEKETTKYNVVNAK